jgi:hypothetical protein
MINRFGSPQDAFLGATDPAAGRLKGKSNRLGSPSSLGCTAWAAFLRAGATTKELRQTNGPGISGAT